jgi:serine-type D-Ala-D-Ala carboxypeptidase/endopeptidase
MRIWKICVEAPPFVLLSFQRKFHTGNHVDSWISSGDYSGKLGELPFKLHLVVAPDGALSGALDSPSQRAFGLPCSEFHVENTTFSFRVAFVRGLWKGSIENNGTRFSGIWNQGNPVPLVFTRDPFLPTDEPLPVDGFWLGTLQTPSKGLRIQIWVRTDGTGQQYCALDSIDQGVFELACSNVSYCPPNFSFDLPSVNARWSGSLSSDGQHLAGTWKQVNEYALSFDRQAKLQRPTLSPLSYDPAIAPVEVADLQDVLRRDLAHALESGLLSPRTSAGVAIGITCRGVRRAFTFGTAELDSIFEIGSVTKTFTGLVLAQLMAQGVVALEEPLRALLPAGIVTQPPGAEITLQDLVTHHSGLPRMPDNFHPANPANPYADYDISKLYEFLAKHGVAKSLDTSCLYSNLGVALLGQALANRADTSYATLLERTVTVPLALTDTVVTLSEAQRRQFIQGHNSRCEAASAFDFNAFAPAGGLRSTVDDLLTYMEAHVHPELSGKEPPATADARTLPNALVSSHELLAENGTGLRLAFAWIYSPSTGSYRHSGATGACTTFAAFNVTHDYAIVVLVNRGLSPQLNSLAELLGLHIGQRLRGEEAITICDSLYESAVPPLLSSVSVSV